MHPDHKATVRDIMMRMHSIHYSAHIYALFDQGKRVSSVFTPETGAHVGGVANRAPHHSACERCAGSAVQRTCSKCNRSARSLPGAAGPVRPAANTATATVHTTFTPEADPVGFL